jgi:hypothetical protein
MFDTSPARTGRAEETGTAMDDMVGTILLAALLGMVFNAVFWGTLAVSLNQSLKGQVGLTGRQRSEARVWAVPASSRRPRACESGVIGPEELRS